MEEGGEEVININVYVQPSFGACYDFVSREGDSKRRTAIMALIFARAGREESGVIQRYGYGCNYGESCYNEDCRYSRAFRELRRPYERRGER